MSLTSAYGRRRSIRSTSEMNAWSRIPFNMFDIWLIRIWCFCLPGVVMMQSMMGKAIIVGCVALVNIVIVVITDVNMIVPWIVTIVDLPMEIQCLKGAVSNVVACDRKPGQAQPGEDSQSQPHRTGSLGTASHAGLVATHLNMRGRKRFLAAVHLGRP